MTYLPDNMIAKVTDEVTSPSMLDITYWSAGIDNVHNPPAGRTTGGGIPIQLTGIGFSHYGIYPYLGMVLCGGMYKKACYTTLLFCFIFQYEHWFTDRCGTAQQPWSSIGEAPDSRKVNRGSSQRNHDIASCADLYVEVSRRGRSQTYGAAGAGPPERPVNRVSTAARCSVNVENRVTDMRGTTAVLSLCTAVAHTCAGVGMYYNYIAWYGDAAMHSSNLANTDSNVFSGECGEIPLVTYLPCDEQPSGVNVCVQLIWGLDVYIPTNNSHSVSIEHVGNDYYGCFDVYKFILTLNVQRIDTMSIPHGVNGVQILLNIADTGSVVRGNCVGEAGCYITVYIGKRLLNTSCSVNHPLRTITVQTSISCLEGDSRCGEPPRNPGPDRRAGRWGARTNDLLGTDNFVNGICAPPGLIPFQPAGRQAPGRRGRGCSHVRMDVVNDCCVGSSNPPNMHLNCVCYTGGRESYLLNSLRNLCTGIYRSFRVARPGDLMQPGDYDNDSATDVYSRVHEHVWCQPNRHCIRELSKAGSGCVNGLCATTDLSTFLSVGRLAPGRRGRWSGHGSKIFLNDNCVGLPNTLKIFFGYMCYIPVRKLPIVNVVRVWCTGLGHPFRVASTYDCGHLLDCDRLGNSADSCVQFVDHIYYQSCMYRVCVLSKTEPGPSHSIRLRMVTWVQGLSCSDMVLLAKRLTRCQTSRASSIDGSSSYQEFLENLVNIKKHYIGCGNSPSSIERTRYTHMGIYDLGIWTLRSTQIRCS